MAQGQDDSNGRRAALRRPIEWPTMLVAAAVHGGWLIATAAFHAMPPLLRVAVGGWLIAWHGSLQHETIHGHPTASRRLNGMIGGVPLALWLPYASYRRTHRAHHDARSIADPFEDPESRYLPAPRGPLDRLRHRIAAAQATLPGRLLLGPIVVVAAFLFGEARGLRRRPAEIARDWAPHLIGVAAVLAWLRHCGIGPGEYALCFVYPGLALTLLRSFAEHRAAAVPAHRIAIVERAGIFSLLFLHNNLHAAHHEAPGLAWYRLPAYHRRHRARLLGGNGGLVYRGYGEVARRFLVRRHDAIVHPDHRAADAA